MLILLPVLPAIPVLFDYLVGYFSTDYSHSKLEQRLKGAALMSRASAQKPHTAAFECRFRKRRAVGLLQGKGILRCALFPHDVAELSRPSHCGPTSKTAFDLACTWLTGD
jgi:hypothetical protein